MQLLLSVWLFVHIFSSGIAWCGPMATRDGAARLTVSEREEALALYAHIAADGLEALKVSPDSLACDI